jgi:hypothetical protein
VFKDDSYAAVSRQFLLVCLAKPQQTVAATLRPGCVNKKVEMELSLGFRAGRFSVVQPPLNDAGLAPECAFGSPMAVAIHSQAICMSRSRSSKLFASCASRTQSRAYFSISMLEMIMTLPLSRRERMLKPHTWRRSGACRGCGLSCWPNAPTR